MRVRIMCSAAAVALMLLVVPVIGLAGGPPSIDWSPSASGSFDYGAVVVGHDASQTFTLANSGGSASARLTVTLSGSASFTVTDDTCTDTSLGPRKWCTVTVEYAPAAAGAESATLHATGVKAAADAAITLTGHGVLQFVANGPAVPGLSGLNENPVRASSATGSAIVTWDTTTSMMTVDVTFSGLTTPNTAAHIHCCVTTPGGNAGVATTTPTFTGFPGGVTSGTYVHTFDMTSLASYNPAFVALHGGTAASAAADLLAGLQAGQAYMNIHTTMFGGGEIRGFLGP